ncbi:hypothetical protein LEP1GSC021_0922 [Leptospira noguchii str. 1993005606]|uniref:Uncharacterized protein n=2 Tax=Leptospira noguchii TaxID=28182 RepID=M6YJ52_9LEPT|nr:hypothetical protein LEP1GSC035_3763 [Leptospira noguchii str. 2007001578]EMO89634.1 hypothetical protein LEP1GSC024_2700 [Leptospira noguchii str. 2001034031]EPE82580.1 hypothetical protein LEP1GSC021_0922 [Leptospira noguchii str. 1993005606]
MKNIYRLGTVIAERENLFQVGKKKSEVHIKGFDSINSIDSAFQMIGLLLVHYFQKLHGFNWLKPEDLIFPPTIKLEELSKNEINLQKNLKKHNVRIECKLNF